MAVAWEEAQLGWISAAAAGENPGDRLCSVRHFLPTRLPLRDISLSLQLSLFTEAQESPR